MSEWVNINDKWPEKGQSVLVVLAPGNFQYGGSIRVCHFNPFDYGDGFIRPEFSMPGFGGMTATHWMPLPQPPTK
jgi:hypothetical protein